MTNGSDLPVNHIEIRGRDLQYIRDAMNEIVEGSFKPRQTDLGGRLALTILSDTGTGEPEIILTDPDCSEIAYSRGEWDEHLECPTCGHSAINLAGGKLCCQEYLDATP